MEKRQNNKIKYKTIKRQWKHNFLVKHKYKRRIYILEYTRKYYSEENGVTLKRLPQGIMFAEEAKVRLMMAVYLCLYIESKKNEGKD